MTAILATLHPHRETWILAVALHRYEVARVRYMTGPGGLTALTTAHASLWSAAREVGMPMTESVARIWAARHLQHVWNIK